MKQYIYIITILLTLAACTPQLEGTAFYSGQEVCLTASVPNATGMGTQLPHKQRITGLDSHPSSPTEGAINLRWSAGDQIRVHVGDSTAIFHIISGEDTYQATFRGEMPASGNIYQVSYPVHYHDSLLRHQNYVANGFGNGLMKMSTKQSGTIDQGFQLSADNALLGLQLTGNHTLDRIILTNRSNDSTYTLHCGGISLQTDEPTLFYLVVPTGNWINGMYVEVRDTDEKIVLRKVKTSATTFEAGKAIVMPQLQTHEWVNTYRFGLTEQLFEESTAPWNMPNRGWAIADQTPIQGSILVGIRLKVRETGSIKLYKTKSLTESNPDNLEYLTTIRADQTGLQDIDFDTPIYLGNDEYIVIGKISDPQELIGNFHPSSPTQPFYNRLGQNKGDYYDHQSLMIDFY